MQLNDHVPFYSKDFGAQAKKKFAKKKKGSRKKKKKKKGHHSGHSGHMATDAHASHGSTRVDHYRGFDIAIETTYQFKVNGKPLEVHAHVLNSGHLHCPDMPNYGWTSAVDFVRELIDSFPDDFEAFQNTKSNKKKRKKKARKKARKKTSNKTTSKKNSGKKKSAKKKSVKKKSNRKKMKTKKSK